MRPLVKIDILGIECVPWSVPDIGNRRFANGTKGHRFAKQNPRMVKWQEYVTVEAKKAMTRLPLTLGPVLLSLTFFKRTPVGKKHGQLWEIPVEWNEEKEKYVKKGRSSPDLINLFKGTEDALEGVVYGNDGQSCIVSSERLYGPLDGVQVQVYEIEPGDYPGHGNPIGVNGHETEPEGEVPATVRVRRRTNSPAKRRGGDKGDEGRTDTVDLAVPSEISVPVPCEPTPTGAGELRPRRRNRRTVDKDRGEGS